MATRTSYDFWGVTKATAQRWQKRPRSTDRILRPRWNKYVHNAKPAAPGDAPPETPPPETP